jgi:N-acetylmuramoyl-L-alanine amidase
LESALKMMPIKYLTIHCTATPQGRANTAKEVREWDIVRFGQASYHWVIELNGNAVEQLKDTEKGAHVAGHNTGNIGISYVGGTATLDAGGAPMDTRTPQQKITLKRLVKEYQAKYPGIVVLGHRDWPDVHKACPSFDVSAWMKAGMPAY